MLPRAGSAWAIGTRRMRNWSKSPIVSTLAYRRFNSQELYRTNWPRYNGSMNLSATFCFWRRLLLLAWVGLANPMLAAGPPIITNSLTLATASAWTRLPLRCIERQYPNKPEHVMNNAEDLRAPQLLHPSFYGCYDWHSAVHAHWMLIRLLRLFPDLPEANQIRLVLKRSFTQERSEIFG